MRLFLIGLGAAAVAVALVVGMTVLMAGSNDRGQLAVSVHDAPCSGCSHVWVTFTAVSVHEAGSAMNSSNGNGSGNGSGEGDHQCGNQSGNQSGNESGDDDGDQSGNDSGNDSGNESGDGSGDQGGNGSGNGSEDDGSGDMGNQSSGDDQGEDCGDQGGDSGDDQGDHGENESGNDSGNESGNETGDHHCGNESGNDSGNQSGNESGGDSGDDLGTDASGVGGSSSASGWITLNVSGQTIDLAALNGSTFAQTIGILSLPAGHYDQIRLAISNVVVQLANGTNVTAKLSGNGFALVHGEFTVAAGATIHVSIDIDLGTSVHLEGNGAVMFTPNIGAVTVS